MIQQPPKPLIPPPPQSQCDPFFTCFTYSPNWYTEQSLCFDPFIPNKLFYASNHLLYLYDLTHHNVQMQLSVKSIIKSSIQKTKHHDIGEKQFKTMKLFSIVATQNYILLGMNEGILVVLDRKLECVLVHRVKIRNINYVIGREVKGEGLEVVVFDENGCCVKVGVKDRQVVRLDMKVEMDGEKRERIKKVGVLHNQFYCFYQRGTIYIFDQNFDKMVRRLTFGKGQSVLYVDNQNENILLISKEKDNLVINYFKIEVGLEFALEHTKTIFEITKSVNKCIVEIEYPKKYYYKRQQMKKAALCIQWLDNGKFMMTGRLAQVYIFSLKNPPKDNKLLLKPYSMQTSQNPLYSTLPQSKHYNQIYQLYRQANHIIMIGTDRNLTFWSIRNDSDLYFEYGIKFLASPVKNILLSKSEKNIVYFLMEDSVIRNWEIYREGSEYKLNQFWKAGQKVKMMEACCDTNEEGVLGCLTEDRRVLFYDIYEERFVRSMQLQTLENHIAIDYVSSEAVPQICKLFEAELTPVKLETKEFSKRKLSEKNWVMVQLANSLVLIKNLDSTAYTCPKYFKDMEKDQKVDGLFVIDQTVIAFIRSPTTLSFKVLTQTQKLLTYKFPEKNVFDYPACRIVESQGIKYLFMSLYSKKDISLYIFNISQQAIVLYKTALLTFNFFIEHTQFDSKGKKLLAYSLNNNTVQIWQLQTHLEDKQQPITNISKNIRAHHGNLLKAKFFMDEFVVSCSQDQNIKVWELSKCQSRAPPKAKKNKKKKGGQQQNTKPKGQKKEANIEVEEDSESEEQVKEVKQNK